jgi:predicted RND superfamily exporter protein
MLFEISNNTIFTSNISNFTIESTTYATFEGLNMTYVESSNNSNNSNSTNTFFDAIDMQIKQAQAEKFTNKNLEHKDILNSNHNSTNKYFMVLFGSIGILCIVIIFLLLIKRYIDFSCDKNLINLFYLILFS